MFDDTFFVWPLPGDEPAEDFGDNLKDVDIPENVQMDFLEQDMKELERAQQEKLTNIDDIS